MMEPPPRGRYAAAVWRFVAFGENDHRYIEYCKCRIRSKDILSKERFILSCHVANYLL